METNKKIGMIVGIVIVVVISFYGGMRYGKNSVATTQSTRFTQGSGNGGGQRGTRGGANGAGFVSGTVLSQDATGITLQLRTGGSQVILTASSTQISKSVIGSTSDLKKGDDVMITGTSNPDGSLTAETIQIRSAESNQAPR